MLLALDIGNTNVTIGVFDGERIGATWRLATDVHRQADEYALQLKNILPMKGVAVDAIDGIVLCSVVPPLTVVFEDACSFLFDIQPLVVGTGTRTGVRVRYDNPRDVGADRVADAAAAYHLYGGPCIVVDFGTATVLDAISADGEYLGGAIAPGLRVSAESLPFNSVRAYLWLHRDDRAHGKSLQARDERPRRHSCGDWWARAHHR
jgi:type III pantothenate kinase